MVDAYEIFLNKFNIRHEDIIEFGIKESKFVEKSNVKQKWELLKSSIITGDQNVFIRGYGRDAKGTNLYLEMYEELYGHSNFIKDSTNNNIPTKVIKELTGYGKNVKTDNKYERIKNFQVSHIFGRTKNPYAFAAPWNIIYIPKIVDPFTGHESKGELTKKFQQQFQRHFINYYSEYILDFNSIMAETLPHINKYLAENIGNKRFSMDLLNQFEPIEIEENPNMNE